MVLGEPVRADPKAGERAVAGRGAGRGEPGPPLEHHARRWARSGLSTSTSWTGAGRLVAHSDRSRPPTEAPNLDVSNVEIVRKFLELRRPCGLHRAHSPWRTQGGKVAKMLGTYARRARLGLGRHRAGGRGQGLLQRHPDADQSWPGGPGDRAGGRVRHRCSPARSRHPIQDLARGRPPAGRGELRHPGQRDSDQRGRGAGRRLQPDGGGDRESPSRRSAGRPPEQGAVHGLHPHAGERHRREGPLHPRPLRAGGLLLVADRQAPGHVARRGGARPPLGDHPRRGQDRHRGQDPAQARGPHRRRVRDHEAAPPARASTSWTPCPCSSRWRAQGSCTTRTGTAAATPDGLQGEARSRCSAAS